MAPDTKTALRPEVCNGAKSANKKRKCVGGGTPQKSVGSMVDYFMPMSKRQDLKKSTEATPEPIPEQPTQKEVLATGSSMVDFFMPMSKWQDLKKSTDATPEPVSEQPMQKEVPETGSSETPKKLNCSVIMAKILGRKSRTSPVRCALQDDVFMPTLRPKQQTALPVDEKIELKPGRKKEGTQEIVGTNTKSFRGVGSEKLDLRTQSRLAAEENARLNEGKALHPFFLRYKVGALKAPMMDGSLLPAPPMHVTQSEEVVIQENAEISWGQICASPDGVAISRRMGEVPNETVCSTDIYQTAYRLSLPKLVDRVALSEDIVEGVDPVSTPTSFPQEGQAEANNCGQNYLWTDRYQPQTSKQVCGNRVSVEALNNWLSSWRERILLGVTTNKENADDDSDSESGWFEDDVDSHDEDDETLPKSLVMTGPVGCGKSAAIYACAKEQGFLVIEVNASECRSGVLIKHKFKEAMESHGLSNWLPSDVAVNVGSPVKAAMVQRAEISKTTGRSGSREDEVIQSQLDPAIVTSGSYGPPPALRRMRVILFEDVDTVFDEDFGFSKALALLSETSKCPIILTSNNQEPEIPQLRHFKILEFQALSMEELVMHAQMVCMAEGVRTCAGMVELLVKVCSHDMRKLFMLLQFWGQGASAGTNELQTEHPDTTLTPVHKPSEGCEFRDVGSGGLVGCLLQLDGCLQGCPSMDLELQRQMNRKCEGTESNVDKQGGLAAAVVANNTGWLWEADTHHRILPHIFQEISPCQLAETIAVQTIEAQQGVDKMEAVAAAKAASKRVLSLQAQADAQKALRRTQNAEKRKANAIARCILPSADAGNQIVSNGDNQLTISKEDQLSLNQLAMETGNPALVCSELLEGADNTGSRSGDHMKMSSSSALFNEQQSTDLLNMGAADGFTSRQSTASVAGELTLIHDTDNVPSERLLQVTGSIPPDIDIDCPVCSTHLTQPYRAASDVSHVHAIHLEQHTSELISVVTATTGQYEQGSLASQESVNSEGPAARYDQFPDAEVMASELVTEHPSMKDFWARLKASQRDLSPLLTSTSRHALERCYVLDKLVTSLSACDVLSSLPGLSEDIHVDSADRCKDIASLLAQMQLSEAVHQLNSSSSLPSGCWQLGSSCAQQDLIRQERQAEVEEVVEAVMPLRSILLGAEARQDYWGFLTRMSQLEDARQIAHDKLSGSRHSSRGFQHYLRSQALSAEHFAGMLEHTMCEKISAHVIM
ncbi:hypothetical protein CY35_06G021400 [Sphagnum magellanicum]|nr:hypothetical protein CY35_06G021400 [Sphagnum magellanicum]